MMQATALVVFLMAAFLSFPMVMRAHMSLAVVMATVVVFPVMMTVMVTFGIGIILQRSRRQGLCGRVGRTGNTAVEFYPRLGQRVARAHTDPAANQRIHLRSLQESG